MNQRELNREVAKKTGETVSTIAAFGFVSLTGQPFEREPLTVDWDQADAGRSFDVFSPHRSGIPAVV